MRDKKLKIKNYFNPTIRFNFSKKFVGNFDKILVDIKKDIKDKNNALNMLDGDYSFSQNIFHLKNLKI